MGTVSCLAAHRSGESLQSNPDPHVHDSTDCNKPVQWDLLGVPSQDAGLSEMELSAARTRPHPNFVTTSTVLYEVLV